LLFAGLKQFGGEGTRQNAPYSGLAVNESDTINVKRVNPHSNPFAEYRFGSPPVSRVATRKAQSAMGSPQGSSDVFALRRGRGGGGGGGWEKRRKTNNTGLEFDGGGETNQHYGGYPPPPPSFPPPLSSSWDSYNPHRSSITTSLPQQPHPSDFNPYGSPPPQPPPVGPNRFQPSVLVQEHPEQDMRYFNDGCEVNIGGQVRAGGVKLRLLVSNFL